MSLSRKLARTQARQVEKNARRAKGAKLRTDQAWMSRVLAAVATLPAGLERDHAMVQMARLDELQRGFAQVRPRLEEIQRKAKVKLTTEDLRQHMTPGERDAVDEYREIRTALEGKLGIALA